MSTLDPPLPLAIWGVHPSWPKIPSLPTDANYRPRDAAIIVGGRVPFASSPIKKRRREHTKIGLCGQCDEPAAPGFKECEAHMAASRARSKRANDLRSQRRAAARAAKDAEP